MKPFSIPILIFLLLLSSASAQPQDPILTLPDGQIILSISATERREVEQDLLIASLSYNASNPDIRVLQEEINKAMQQSIDLLKKEKELKFHTGAYQVYEVVDPRSKEKKWQGRQSVTVKSKNSDLLLKTVAKLQSLNLGMESLSYVVAPETQVEIQDSLMEAALKQLQDRANRAAKALNKSQAELKDVNVISESPAYQPMRTFAMRQQADMLEAAPAAAPGETTITLSVSARAILKP